MAFTKQVSVWVDGITEDGVLNVVRMVRGLEDGAQFAERQPERIALTPGTDVSQYPIRVQRVATAEWTPAAIAAWQAKMAAAKLVGP